MLDLTDLSSFDDMTSDNSIGEDFGMEENLCHLNHIDNPALQDNSFNSELSYNFGEGQDDTPYSNLLELDETTTLGKSHSTGEHESTPNAIDLSQLEDELAGNRGNNSASSIEMNDSLHPHDTQGDMGDNNISFKGYTKDEIQRHMAKAEKEMHYHENQVSHHSYLANHNLGEADMKSHLNEVRTHQREVEHWKNEYQKWKWTKPDPEK